MIYAIVDTTASRVLTRIEYDEAPSTPPPGFDEGVIAIQHDDADERWTWDGSALVAPPPPAPAPLPPVTVVTPRQARLALYTFGLLDQVEAAVVAQGGTTKIAWEYATQVERNDPLVAALSSALNLTSEQLDDLFALAGTL